MIKIEGNWIKTADHRGHPSGEAKPQRSKKLQGQSPLGKPLASSLPEQKCSHMVVYLIMKGVPSPNTERERGFVRYTPTVPQFTTNDPQYAKTHHTESSRLPKPAIASPVTSHYWYQNSEGLMRMNLKSEILMDYVLTRSPPSVLTIETLEAFLRTAEPPQMSA